MTRFCLLPLVFLFLSVFAWPVDAARELRGLWVLRTTLRSPESIDRMVEEAAAAGFNTVFVQVRGRGDALYQSQLLPRSVLLKEQPRRFDPLAYTLRQAHRRGIEVHAWMNIMLVAGFSDRPAEASHVLNRHRDWLSIPRSLGGQVLPGSSRGLIRLARESRRSGDDVEGFFLDPGVPGVPEHLEGIVGELVKNYPVDGVHFDYFRYPNSNFGYSSSALESFRTEVEGRLSSPKERARLRSRSKKDRLIHTRSFPVAWADFRRRRITELLTKLNRAVKETRPSVLVSVAVVADGQKAREEKMQDWKLWLADGILDAVCPMAYSPDNSTFKAQVAAARRVASRGSVWAGIGAWRMKVGGILEKIEITRDIDTAGFILFSYDALTTRSSSNPAGRNLRRIGSYLADRNSD